MSLHLQTDSTNKTIHYFNGTWEVVGEVVCPLPDNIVRPLGATLPSSTQQNLMVAISNNGTEPFSNELTVSIYDSECRGCSVPGQCYFKVQLNWPKK